MKCRTIIQFALLVSLLFQGLYAYSQADSPPPASRDGIYLDWLIGEVHKEEETHPAHAFMLLSDGLHLSDSLRDDERMGIILELFGDRSRKHRDLGHAMEAYMDALELFEKTGDIKEKAAMHHKIALTYMEDEEYDSAMKEENMALELRKQLNDSHAIDDIYGSMGEIYSIMGDYDKALEYLHLALEHVVKEKNEERTANFLSLIGVALRRKGEYKAGRSKNFEAMAIHRREGFRETEAKELYNIGLSYHKEGNDDSALVFLEQSYHLAAELKMLSLQGPLSREIWNTYTAKGQYQKANLWAAKTIRYQDSIHHDMMTSEVEAAKLSHQIHYEERAREQAIIAEKLREESELKSQRILSYALAFGGGLLALLAFVLFRRFKEKRNANIILEQKVEERTLELSLSNARLFEEIAEKEKAQEALNTFLYRSSHDMRGPITSLKGLMNLATEEDGDAEVYLPMISGKIYQLDWVLKQMIEKMEVESRELKHEPVRWEDIWAQIMEELGTRPGFDDCEFELINETTRPVISDSYLMRVLIKQLLQNAIDFRNRDQGKGLCKVRITGGGENWNIHIEDNGIGIPRDILPEVFTLFFRGDNKSVGAGIGLFIAQSIGYLLEAKIKVDSGEGGPTRIEIGKS